LRAGGINPPQRPEIWAPFLVSAQNALRLSPLAALCRVVIRRWIEVVRTGRGGQIDVNGTPWTRLPADELLEQLEEEYGVEVSIRTLRRALSELTTAGAVRREQRWCHRWKRDYWYAPTAEEEALHRARPQVVAAKAVADRRTQRRPHERPPVAAQVLSLSSSDQVSRRRPANQQPAATPQERKEATGVATTSPAQGGHGQALQAPPTPSHWPEAATPQQTLQALENIRRAVPWLNRGRPALGFGAA
jgi:DNA-binding transcriptional ArsR family regulator